MTGPIGDPRSVARPRVSDPSARPLVRRPTFSTLRAELDRRAVAQAAVVLPGDPRPASALDAPLEGALHVTWDGPGYALSTVDYGHTTVLARCPSEPVAARRLLQYLDRPLPPRVRLQPHEVDDAEGRAAPALFELRHRAAHGPLRVELPAGVLLDRVGALDGTMLFPYGTSLEARALPPMNPQAGYHPLRTVVPLAVHVQVAAPWSGQPGGGLRCTLAQEGVGVRDLVVRGLLERVSPVR
ncbi:TNT domain-containing protein [Xylanimonas oleitrophica]|nr:TNT domain-containing protein [Xylanimonas oleitrophica]